MSNKIILRNYQQEVIEETRSLLSKGIKHIMAQLPTGGGKTIIFSFITQNAEAKGKNVLILTDRTELLTQAGGTISKFNISPAYIKAGSKYIDYRRNVFVAMSQTLRNRVVIDDWQKWIKTHIDIVIIDEAHIQEFNYLFESGLIDDKIVIGFTATPVRTGKMRQLGLDYERMVQGTGIRELIKDGYLLNCDTYAFQSPSMSNVSVNAKTGDFQGDSMFKQFNSPTLYAGLLTNYEKNTPGQKMLVFCCNVEHAIKTCQTLNDSGYTVKFLASKKSPPKKPKENAKIGEIERYKERLRVYELYEQNYKKYSGGRKGVLKWFSNTSGSILINVDILTKGYDEPSIEVIALYRATTSLSLYLQMIGRGSRLYEDMTNFTLFDFGGNVDRLGNYDDNRSFGLWHEEKKGEGGAPPLKECGIDSNSRPITACGDVKKGCKRLIMASMKLCPFCGFKYPEKDPAKEVELALASIKDDDGVSLNVKSFKNMNHLELKQYRDIKNHKMAWLWRQLWMRGGEKELRQFAIFDNWNDGATNRAVSFCKQKFA